MTIQTPCANTTRWAVDITVFIDGGTEDEAEDSAVRIAESLPNAAVQNNARRVG